MSIDLTGDEVKYQICLEFGLDKDKCSMVLLEVIGDQRNIYYLHDTVTIKEVFERDAIDFGEHIFFIDEFHDEEFGEIFLSTEIQNLYLRERPDLDVQIF